MWELLTYYLVVALDCLDYIISKAHVKWYIILLLRYKYHRRGRFLLIIRNRELSRYSKDNSAKRPLIKYVCSYERHKINQKPLTEQETTLQIINQKFKQSYVCRISSCFSPKYLLVMLTLEWMNHSISLTSASSALSEDSNTFLPNV